MKTCFLLTSLVVLFCPADPLLANPAARGLLQLAFKTSGTEVLEAGSREALERAAANSLRLLGAPAAETAVQRGGIQLLEASLYHGDEVLRLAGRVPEAAGLLGARPLEALRLASRHGDDALRLEARVPGLAEQAISLLGREAVPTLTQAAPGDVTRLLGFAARADSAVTRAALWHAWKKEGGALLDKLDKHKVLILTGGLTGAVLDVASGVSNAIEKMPEKAPEALKVLGSWTGAGIAISLILVSAAFIAPRVFRFRRQPRS